MSQISVEQINVLLPQTQCTKCGFSGCKPYASAISKGLVDINQCPPGGERGINRLAALLNVEEKPLNTEFGNEQPRKVAFIVEQDCIGCTKCLPPCPVDAILGANKQMHTILTDECTGCELCVIPCPVDCIIMLDVSSVGEWGGAEAGRARRRYEKKQRYQDKQELEKLERIKKQKMMLAKLKKAKV